MAAVKRKSVPALLQDRGQLQGRGFNQGKRGKSGESSAGREKGK